MKKLFNRTLSVLCTVMLLISAVSAWAVAEEEAATPTDLIPQEGEIIPEEPGKEPEPEGDGITSVEVVITKTLTVGQSWEGKMKKTKPAVLKLDVTRPGLVYMLVEGKDVWATVEKSDRQTENPTRTKTDPETDRMVISWEAEEGSYLITLGPVEPNLLAMATVSFMDKTAYGAWEAEQAENEPEVEEEPEPEEEPEAEPDEEEQKEATVEEPEKEPEEEPGTESEEAETEPEIELEKEPEEEQIPEEKSEIELAEEPKLAEKAKLDTEEQNEQEAIPETTGLVERDISIEITSDSPNPVIGDTAHFIATLTGYDQLNYSVQWQYSEDKQIWNDIPNANELIMDVVTTKINNSYYWRIVIYIEDQEDQEG